MIKTILQVLLVIHIAAGFTALVTGLLAIIFSKTGKYHRPVGKVYFWAMTIVAITALVIAIAKGLTFLLMIGIFSFYFALTGYRAVLLKGRPSGLIDMLAVGIAAITGIFMIITLDIVLTVFAIILFANVYGDIRHIRNKDKALRSKIWMFMHIGKMLGSYIATVTAFLVTNVNMGNPLLAWLLPTVLGVPVIFWYTSKYRKKIFKAKQGVVKAV